ncbi:iron-responsive transcriptional regulator [Adhaeretor mobilis]|uniref:Iron-responsive transcriptional regulator n=2 Tax=Adhaeretor mobilis TaxID=1930276 RepID=A0A517MV85_9BACT|nr:iron-responsive transcriptional regulator [Adhaeretor mobilis]
MSTIPEMSRAIQVNAPYLRKVLDKLREQGIVGTQRGTGGGTHLSVSPDDLTILDVLNAVDSLQRITSCPLGLPGHTKLCPLHSEVDEAIATVEKALGSRTIGELLSARRNPGGCEFPKAADLYQL